MTGAIPLIDSILQRTVVDPRTELMSVLWRLGGGKPEYAQKPRNARYIEEAIEYFGPHRAHPCVRFVAQVQERWGAPMALAVHLSDAVSLQERVPFEPIPPGIENCWGPDGAKTALRVAAEARGFAADADFDRFWRMHESLYGETEARYRRFVGSQIQWSWFADFFGSRRAATLHVILCLLNGGCCYPTQVTYGQSEEYYCFLGVPLWDDHGIPVPVQNGWSPVEDLVHEFVHLYTDRSLYLSAEGVQTAGESLLRRAENCQLDMEAYGNWVRVVDESVANACTVRYVLASQGEEAADRSIRERAAKGFPWIRKLSDLLGVYERNRSRFADFDAFVPELAAFFRDEASLASGGNESL